MGAEDERNDQGDHVGQRGAVDYRPATVSDLPTLAELRWEMEAERHPDEVSEERRVAYLAAYIADCEPELAAGRHQAWVAVADGHPVACATLIPWVMPPNMEELHRKRGFVSSVYTRPAYRRQGIARHIMEMVLAAAHKQGISRLILWASEMGSPLYLDLGFIPSRGYEFNFDR